MRAEREAQIRWRMDHAYVGEIPGIIRDLLAEIDALRASLSSREATLEEAYKAVEQYLDETNRLRREVRQLREVADPKNAAARPDQGAK